MNPLGGVDLLRGFDSPFSYPNLLMDFMPLERYDQVDTKLLETILSKQQAAGYWRLADLCEAVPAFQPNVVQSRIGNNANMDPIWATVMAQAFLTRIFPSQKNWWDMAFQKAKMWLSSVQLPPTAAAQFEAEAVSILSAEYERLCRLWDRYRDNGNKSSKSQFDAKIAQLQLVLQVSQDLWIGRENATGHFFAVGRSRYGFGWFYSVDPVEAERVHQIQQQKEQLLKQQSPHQQQQPQPQQQLGLPQPLKQPKPQRYQAINAVNGAAQGQFN